MNQRELRNIILFEFFTLGIDKGDEYWDSFIERKHGGKMTMPQEERYVKAWNDAISVFERTLGRDL